MKEKVLSWCVSVALTSCLFSGLFIAQQFAVYALLVFNIIGWLGVFAMSKLGVDSWLKITQFAVIMWSLTAAQIGGLVYAGYPSLAASSLICSMFIYGGALQNLKKMENV